MSRNTHSSAPGSPQGESFILRIVRTFTTSRLSPLMILASLLVGAASLYLTPREEDPQLDQPVMQVILQAPGSSAQEMAASVATPVEQLLKNLREVEDVYSTSREGLTVVSAKFEVGVKAEQAQVRFYNQIAIHADRIPQHVKGWAIRSVDVDDVPVVSFQLHSKTRSDFELRRLAEELMPKLQEVNNASRSWILGGQHRQIQAQVDAQKAAEYGLSITQIAEQVAAANRARDFGALTNANLNVPVNTRYELRDVDEAGALIVAMHDGRPVYLRDVAKVVDGPAERDTLTRVAYGPACEDAELRQVTGVSNVELAIAKRRGSNAAWVSRDLIKKMESAAKDILPADVQWAVSRDYGWRANLRIEELTMHLGISIVIILVLMLLTLSWREAVIITITVPQILGFTLLIVLLGGYTINGVTLFALIISLGLLVDDPIVDVENVSRHLALGREKSMVEVVVGALREILSPTILATFCVVASFVPIFFVTGLIGPYLRPLPFTVSWAMVASLVISLTTTPWLCHWILGPMLGKTAVHEEGTGGIFRVYRTIFSPLVRKPWLGAAFLGVLCFALVGSWWLALSGRVPVKLLPFMNNHDVQVYVDMPEGTSLERTSTVAAAIERELVGIREVSSVETYVGLPSPIDQNTVAKQGEMRLGSHKADLRIYFMPKPERARTSREMMLEVRPRLCELEKEYGAKIKIIERPAGPPVKATIVGELYAPARATQAQTVQVARDVLARMRTQDYLCDVDSSLGDDPARWRFVMDRSKPMLSGITNANIESVLAGALDGMDAGLVHETMERYPLAIKVWLNRTDRARIDSLEQLYVQSPTGARVQLRELGHFVSDTVEQPVEHKNSREVVYLMAEANGPSPIDCLHRLDKVLGPDVLPAGYTITWGGEGEWRLTLLAIRDLGLAFAAALVVIYILLVAQLQSFALPLLIMISIPLTFVGIFPCYWILNQVLGHEIHGVANPFFFTATSIVGVIAVSGIVVRNGIILIDFIELKLVHDRLPLVDALIRAGATRLRPICLTALTAVLASLIITLDPTFCGLAWSFISGIFMSTLFTLIVIPLVYGLIFWPLFGKKRMAQLQEKMADADASEAQAPEAATAASN